MRAAPEKAKILMVDDEPKNLLALEAVLESLGQVLVRAQSSQEALHCLLDDDFAVILLDVQMPETDGFEFAALVRGREKNRCTPIIFLTAVGKSEAEMLRGYEVGAVDYMHKPFFPAVLRHKVSVLVELYQKPAEISRLNGQLLAANAGLSQSVQERTAALELRSLDLLRSNQELAQFASVASHDLQEPLRTLSTYLQMVRENNLAKLNAQDKEFMEIVVDSARRMRTLINDLLAFSQVGQGERAPGPVDCSALVARILGQLKDVIEEGGGSVEVGPLPVVEGEAALLGQVFQNLIGNALKFCHGQAPKVELQATRTDAEWVFTVKDQGIGIAPDHFEKIFKLFRRLHSRDEYPGTGLGLSICKKVVERHGGRIWLESALGAGSTFCFSLPAKG